MIWRLLSFRSTTQRNLFLLAVFLLAFSCLVSYCQGVRTVRRTYYSGRSTYYGSYYRSGGYYRSSYRSSLRGGTVAGVVVGGLIGALFFTVMVFICIRLCCPEQYRKCCGRRQTRAHVHPVPRQVPKRINPQNPHPNHVAGPAGQMGPPRGPPPPGFAPPPYYGPGPAGAGQGLPPPGKVQYPEAAALYPAYSAQPAQPMPQPAGPMYQPTDQTGNVAPPSYDAVYPQPSTQRY